MSLNHLVPVGRPVSLSVEQMEARALALLEGANALNEIAGKTEDDIERAEFYRLGKKLWIGYTKMRDLAARQKQTEKGDLG